MQIHIVQIEKKERKEVSGFPTKNLTMRLAKEHIYTDIHSPGHRQHCVKARSEGAGDRAKRVNGKENG